MRKCNQLSAPGDAYRAVCYSISFALLLFFLKIPLYDTRDKKQWVWNMKRTGQEAENCERS